MAPVRVLVPLDGSVLARAAMLPAIQLVTALAAPGQGAIHLTRVVKHERQPGEVLDALTREHLLHEAKTYVQSVASQMREGFITAFTGTVTWSVVLDNDTAAAIIREAENGEDAEGAGVFGGCDIIALSMHGRKGLQRFAIGSVTERVLSGTRLPVLIVRLHDKLTDDSSVGAQARRYQFINE